MTADHADDVDAGKETATTKNQPQKQVLEIITDNITDAVSDDHANDVKDGKATVIKTQPKNRHS